MPRFLSAALGGVAAAVLVALVMPGCVDPKGDYTDWLSRTADARAGGSIIDVGTTDGGLPDGGFTGTYAMACSTSVVPGAQDATRFVATATYTPNASGAGGTLYFQNQPLVVGATTLSDTVGNRSNNVPVTIGADGKGSLVYGPTTIPGAANPVTSGDVVFDADATLHFIVGQDSFCAGLTGTIKSPLQVNMDPAKGDVCVFLPSTGDFPQITDDMFTSSPCHAPP